MGLSQRRKPLRGCDSSHMRAHAFRFCKRAWVSDKRSEAKKQKCGTKGDGLLTSSAVEGAFLHSHVARCGADWDMVLLGTAKNERAGDVRGTRGRRSLRVCIERCGQECSKRKRRYRQSTGQAGSCRFHVGSVSFGRATIQPAVKTARILWLVVAPFPYCTLFHRPTW